MKIKQTEQRNADDKLKAVRRELKVLKKLDEQSGEERISDIEAKLRAQYQINLELGKELKGLK